MPEWWPRAALRRDEDFDLERKVTWLELFFDLVFVVVLARLAHTLAHGIDPAGLADFAIQFAAVFWAWNAFTYYIERFESGGLENRAFVFAAMAALGAVAVWTEDGLGARYSGFAAAYVATRAVNMVQWLRAGSHVPVFRPVMARFLAGFAVVAALVVVAGRLDGDARRLVFAFAVLLDVATPVATLRTQAGLPRLSTSKFPERFGLLTMIVLGEAVGGVIAGVSALNEAGVLGAAQMVDGALGLCVGVGLWWVYFDFIARRPPKPRIATALGWVYLHLVTLAAITCVGASIPVAIAESVEHGVPEPVRLLFGGSAAVALMGMAALETTLTRRPDEPTHPIGSPALKAVAAVGLGIVTVPNLGWSTAGLFAAVVIALAIPAIYGMLVWYRRTEEPPTPDPSGRAVN